KWARNSASRVSGFVSCKTSRCRSCAARSARKSAQWTSSCRWKLKPDHARTWSPRVLLSFHQTQLDRIDQRTAHSHIADNHHVISARSPLVLAQKLLGRCNRPVPTAREIDEGGKRSPRERELPINFLAWGESEDRCALRPQI